MVLYKNMIVFSLGKRAVAYWSRWVTYENDHWCTGEKLPSESYASSKNYRSVITIGKLPWRFTTGKPQLKNNRYQSKLVVDELLLWMTIHAPVKNYRRRISISYCCKWLDELLLWMTIHAPVKNCRRRILMSYCYKWLFMQWWKLPLESYISLENWRKVITPRELSHRFTTEKL
jgi:hypothetical protein